MQKQVDTVNTGTLFSTNDALACNMQYVEHVVECNEVQAMRTSQTQSKDGKNSVVLIQP